MHMQQFPYRMLVPTAILVKIRLWVYKEAT